MRLAATFAFLSCSIASAQTPSETPAPVAAPPVAAPVAVPPAALPMQHEPLAGYNGSFFIRDPNDWFVLFPKGRLQFDGYSFLNRGDVPANQLSNGSGDPRPKNTVFVRRARVEVQGTFMRHWDFHLAGEYATTPSTGQTGIVADAYVIADYLEYLKIQAGQFDIPFTLENRTSDKYFDFMERSIPVRAFAVPTNKDQGVMLWGWLPKHVAYYSLGLFNGEGQNFKNQDNWPAIIGRGFVAPLAWMPQVKDKMPWLQHIWVGGSIWWQRNSFIGGAQAASTGAAQNDIPSMTTQGGFTFFNASYANGTDANGPIRSHLTPNGDILKWAVEANVPIWKLGLRFELMHVSEGIAQFNDVVALSPASVPGIKRTGGTYLAGYQNASLDGYGWYIQAWGWILGDNSFIEPPGLELTPHMNKKYIWKKDPKWGLMVTAKYEHLGFTINGLPGTMQAGGTLVADPQVGNVQVHVFELGLNAWATKHVRLTANYIMNWVTGDDSNASGAVKKNYYFGRPEHELLARVGINL